MADPVRVTRYDGIGLIGHLDPDDLARAVLALLATDAGQRAIREGVDARLRQLSAIAETLGEHGAEVAFVVGSFLDSATAYDPVAPREPAQDEPTAEKCPRCGSPKPQLHPAMQADGGEVQPCPHPFHDQPSQPPVDPGTLAALRALDAGTAQDEPAAGVPQDPPDSGDDPFAAAHAAGFAEGVEAERKRMADKIRDYARYGSIPGDTRDALLADLAPGSLTPPAAPDPLLAGLRAARAQARHIRAQGLSATMSFDLLCDWLDQHGGDAEIARREGGQ